MFDLVLDSTFAGCRIEAVALKLVAPERAADANFRARFEREARVAAIEHPNVIPVSAPARRTDGSTS